ncbi:MAG: hypothetical protein CMM92_07200 [Rickettsiales bacterium]|nr:hypothetical protein [Rickettsiales bacterium]RPG12401.1 MAG: hypothetical protein CBD55_007140 [Pelagibacteraceae bacterium TMED195]|tara:strand:+ start:297 stop:1133 length:837 start_codon:yes stop_codon:yes gene_type:complete
MIIEKSPFYNKNINLNSENSEKLIEKNTSSQDSEKNEFSFWSWFKGLVNPLQNLPLISGIYSSMNSENAESDRDLIQNSLGGFLYGGPFGAIAGFGNWVFNKIFDKTPTELALDATGISDIWKEEGEELEKIAKNNGSNDGEKKLYIQYSGIHQKSDTQKHAFSNVGIEKKLNKMHRAPDVNIIGKSEQLDITKNKSIEKIDDSIVKGLPEINDNSSVQKTKEILTNEEKFREINFSYPEWSPSESDSKVLENKPLSSRIKYLDIENSDNKSTFSFNV